MMSTKSLVAVAAVAAALVASAGLPLTQATAGWGAGVASASPCPPFMPCQGPPKPPKLPDGGGPKGPRVPEFGGGPKGPDLPGFGGGPKGPGFGGGPKGPDFGGGPKGPDFGGGPKGPDLGGGPKGPDLGGGPGPKGPDFGGGPGPGFNGPALRGPGDVRHALTLGGPPAGARIDVPGALRIPTDLRPDFGPNVHGPGRLNPDAHINFRWPGGP